MKKTILNIIKVILGSAVFALGFDLFLAPHGLNAGGISGLALIFVELTGALSIGLITAAINLPLFAIGGLKVGKEFFWLSAVGMAVSSLCIDLFTMIPQPDVEPLLCALYGGLVCGVGLGIVFATGGSTGGSDIVVRLLKLRWQHVPIGMISMTFDACVAALTGIVFWDVTKALYSGVAIFVTGKVIDTVVYSFDFSKVAIIISPQYEQIAAAIDSKLGRGITFLDGQGFYSRKDTKVVLTAVKRQQVAELKKLVMEIDESAFVIVQDAHQVLGDGFSSYSKHSL
jgi:uncharacterized membrane-anchored protein YitT (DUF2179 family)